VFIGDATMLIRRLRSAAAAVGLFALGTMLFTGRAIADDDRKTEDKAYEQLAAQAAELERLGRLFESIHKVVSPSVVHIQSRRGASFMERNFTFEETGSGVIVRLPGHEMPYVLTNNHVVENSEPQHLVITTADRRLLHAMKLWKDGPSDVAVLAIAEKDVRSARLGDSDKLEIGHWVLAIGSPFDLAGSLTHGIVSSKGRRSLKLGTSDTAGVINQDFIQTDAPINPGNSGGPLVNLRGEVVGLNTAIASQSGGSEGVGFSIPANLVRRIALELIEKGNITRAFLGIGFDPPLDPKMALKLGLARHRGAVIEAVFDNTPAMAAGLESLDVVTEFNGRPVEDNEHLTHMISMTPVNQEVTLTVWHNREMKKVTARLGDRSDSQRASGGRPEPLPKLGLFVRELTDAHRRQLALGDQKGILVIRVASHKPAAQLVESLDVIDQVGGRPVSLISDLTAALRGTDESGVRVRIVRPGPQGPTQHEVTLKP